MRTLPPEGRAREKQVRDEATGEDRPARLVVSCAPVRLCPPAVKRGVYEERHLLMWCIRVWEVDVPEGCKRVEWFLLHNRPVTGAAAAWECCDWYGCRPMVEEYHKGKKTGCQIEDLQFESSGALRPMIALLSVVAVMLLQLREACRQPDAATRPATDLVDPVYEEVLRAWRYRGRESPLTVHEFYLALARLGGHMNRKRDGLPGWLVLWRGWMKLQVMVTGVEADRRQQKRADDLSKNRGET